MDQSKDKVWVFAKEGTRGEFKKEYNGIAELFKNGEKAKENYVHKNKGLIKPVKKRVDPLILGVLSEIEKERNS